MRSPFSSFGLLSYPTFQTGDAPDPAKMQGMPMGLFGAFSGRDWEAKEPQQQPQQAGYQPVDAPLPPVRPAGLGAPQASAPMDIKPNGILAQDAPQAGGILGGVDKFIDKLGSVYGNGGAGDMLINLGLAVASPGDKAANLQRALSMSAQQRMLQGNLQMQQLKLQKEQASQQGNVEMVKKAMPGVTDQQAMAIAANPTQMNEVFKRLNPTEQFKTETDAQGNQWQINTINGQRSLLKQASEEFRQLTDPAERAKYGIPDGDKNLYRVDSRGKVEQIGQPSTNVTVNSAVNPILKGMGDQFVSGAESARGAADRIRGLHSAREQLDSGKVILGAGADARLAAQKLGALLGIADADKIQNTEAFGAAAATSVLGSAKSLPGALSDKDVAFLKEAAGSSTKLDEGSIRRIIDMHERVARAQIERHNSLADQMLKQQPDLAAVGPMLRVMAPDPYKAPERPQMQQAPQPAQGAVQGPAVGFVSKGYRFIGGNPSNPNSWQKVQ